MIPRKTPDELRKMKESGRVLAEVLKELRPRVKEGVSGSQLDREAEGLILKHGAIPAFKGYRGYPAAICFSVNDEIVHGIPGAREIADGDIVSIDLGVKLQGFFSDAAFTAAVGKVAPVHKSLVAVAEEALTRGIKQARAGNRLFDISFAIQQYAEANGFSVVRQFVGHGIGKNLHEEPEIPNFGAAHHGPLLEEGMVLAIEPMVNLGGWEAYIADNGWTARTMDGLASAHFEHTVAIGPDGPEVLTA